jgi:hypothetical protein
MLAVAADVYVPTICARRRTDSKAPAPRRPWGVANGSAYA